MSKDNIFSHHKNITTAILAVVMLLLQSNCSDKDANLVSLDYDPESTPTMITRDVTTLISDSGITRYKLDADVWYVFDKASEPHWYFPEGIYVERFTPDFQIEATINADTAWYYTAKELWELKKDVHVENMQGEQFDCQELFWNQKEEKVYSSSYIEITTVDGKLKGYGFESNQTMTEYRIFNPHDGLFPVKEANYSNNQNDSLSVDTQTSTP